MTARDIQRAIMVERYRRSFVLHNYTPAKWWECDVFEITDAGFFREYEIKLTVGDFKADAKKERYGFEFDAVTNKVVHPRIGSKHELLAERSVVGPSAFWFVIPVDLVSLEVVPGWAGVITATEWSGHKPPWNVRLNIVRQAPRLHSEKVSDAIAEHARGVCYYRMHNLFNFGRIGCPIEAPEELTANPQ